MTLVYAKNKFPYSYTLPCIYPFVNLIRFAFAKKNATTKKGSRNVMGAELCHATDVM